MKMTPDQSCLVSRILSVGRRAMHKEFSFEVKIGRQPAIKFGNCQNNANQKDRPKVIGGNRDYLIEARADWPSREGVGFRTAAVSAR